MLHETDLSRSDLNLLVLFEAVMEARHVGRAAERLNLSASAVSHGLGRLRALLGDPLFLRTPKGVIPTDRAERLAPQISEVLAGVRAIVSSASPFDPAHSRRRFVLGAPDAVSAVLVPPLLRRLDQAAPGVDLSVRQLLPRRGTTDLSGAWAGALTELEARGCDLVVVPLDQVPKRFVARELYLEDFVIAARRKHPILRDPSLARFLDARHILVSESGDAAGMVDATLAALGQARRIALTLPNFMFAMSMLAETDFVCALPRRLVRQHGGRLGVASAELPVQLAWSRLNMVVPQVALTDAGVAWMMSALEEAAASEQP
jgi:DNA-binding transcriptional LysR family regulator